VPAGCARPRRTGCTPARTPSVLGSGRGDRVRIRRRLCFSSAVTRVRTGASAAGPSRAPGYARRPRPLEASRRAHPATSFVGYQAADADRPSSADATGSFGTRRPIVLDLDPVSGPNPPISPRICTYQGARPRGLIHAIAGTSAAQQDDRRLPENRGVPGSIPGLAIFDLLKPLLSAVWASLGGVISYTDERRRCAVLRRRSGVR
jgi:hypothetical protein